MKTENAVLLAVGLLVGYTIYKKGSQVLETPQALVNAVVNTPAEIVSDIQTGINTPGGLLGANSVSSIPIIPVATDIIDTIQTGINTPGGILGADSLTDLKTYTTPIMKWVEPYTTASISTVINTASTSTASTITNAYMSAREAALAAFKARLG